MNLIFSWNTYFAGSATRSGALCDLLPVVCVQGTDVFLDIVTPLVFGQTKIGRRPVS